MNTFGKIIETILPLVAVILVVSQVVVSNQLVALGGELGKLDVEIRKEIDVKESLSIEVASASSLLMLRERAKDLGFMDPTSKQIITISREIPVALGFGSGIPLRPVE